jgi:hypothetical protein
VKHKILNNGFFTIAGDGMFRRREEVRKWLYEVVEKFRQRGATSPDKAMTAEELGLPPIFKEAVKRHLGRLGIFVEVNGKYYLSEERLKQMEEMHVTRSSAWKIRKRIITLRLAQLVTLALFVTILLLNLFVQSWELRIASAFLLGAWLIMAILQIYYTLHTRKVSMQQTEKRN